MQRLFIYGTLAPGRPNAHVMAGIPGTWEPATVRGRLIQQGWGAAQGYPGIILDEHGDTIDGLIFSSNALAAHLPRLDAFEGSEYQRVTTTATLQDGTRVAACIYALCP